jgi:hypothetical protein
MRLFYPVWVWVFSGVFCRNHDRDQFYVCKSLIIKVFQRSRGVNFTNGTWNKVFGGGEGSVSSCFIYIYYIIIIIIERGKKGYVPAFQRFC